MKTYTEIRVTAPRMSLVLHIPLSRDYPKVGDAIVATTAVYVVELTIRPVTMHIAPRRTVGQIPAAINLQLRVSVGANLPDR